MSSQTCKQAQSLWQQICPSPLKHEGTRWLSASRKPFLSISQAPATTVSVAGTSVKLVSCFQGIPPFCESVEINRVVQNSGLAQIFWVTAKRNNPPFLGPKPLKHFFRMLVVNSCSSDALKLDEFVFTWTRWDFGRCMSWICSEHRGKHSVHIRSSLCLESVSKWTFSLFGFGCFLGPSCSRQLWQLTDS